MKASTTEKAKGKLLEIKGRAKERIGRSTNNPDMEDQGRAEHFSGKIREKIGELAKLLGK